MPRVVAAAVLAIGLAGAGYLTAARVSAAPSPATVTYCAPGGEPLAMDLYEPAHPSGRAVLYVHGGAWVSGSRKDTGDLFPQLLPRLLEQGDVVAAIDYRLADTAPWPAPLDDTRCALDYLRTHSRTIHLDPDHVALYGTSAGGQIVAMAGLEHLRGVSRVADLYGPADLAARGWSPWLRGDIRKEFGGGLNAASPADQVTPGAPPFLVVQGDCDDIVAPGQSRELVARLRTAGDRVALMQVHNAGHGLWECGGGPQDPSRDQVAADVAAFLNG